MNTESKTAAPASLFKSTSIVASMTMLSRVCGFVRDMVIAQLFGAGASMDAFWVAFKIPNFMRRLFAEGAFAQGFVPILAEYTKTRSEAEVREFISHMFGVLGLVLLLVTIVAELAAPLLVMLFAPGFVDEALRFHLTSSLLRWTFPYLLFISLTAFAGSVLNTFGRFAIPAFTPVLLNLSLITAALLGTHYLEQPIMALAWGVFVAGIVQFLFQLPFLLRLKLLPMPKVSWQDHGVMRVLKLMVPALFGVSVAQISLLIDTVFASFLQIGSVSWLYYSERITSLPLGVFGVAIATVVLPHLSRKHAEKSQAEYSASLDWGLRGVLLIGLPAMIGLLLLAGPLLTTLFQYGEFGVRDALMAKRSLIGFTIGVPAFMLIKVLATGFYARQDIRTPVKFAVIALLFNIGLIFCLIGPLQHAGLALATSLSSTLNASLLMIALLRRGIFQPSAGWGKFALQLLIANLVMGIALWWGTDDLIQWQVWSWSMRFLHLLMLIFSAAFLYFYTLYICGMRRSDWRQGA